MRLLYGMTRSENPLIKQGPTTTVALRITIKAILVKP